jgi:hypothetical protein
MKLTTKLLEVKAKIFKYDNRSEKEREDASAISYEFSDPESWMNLISKAKWRKGPPFMRPILGNVD